MWRARKQVILSGSYAIYSARSLFVGRELGIWSSPSALLMLLNSTIAAFSGEAVAANPPIKGLHINNFNLIWPPDLRMSTFKSTPSDEQGKS